MSSVDSRIVTMKFDNAQFEQGARTSMSTLDKLKSSLNFSAAASGATKGLGGVAGVLGRFISIKNPFSSATTGLSELQRGSQQMGATGFTSIEGGINHISKSFVAMSTIAITALTNITNKAINVGTELTKSLTVDPIKMGLDEYETNLNSIQTILANTKASGANLGDVNAALDELNRYSDQTIYNFTEMARNIGTFTAAGVDLETSVGSIKGIANLAALSGSNSQQASTAMYQLSQEIAAGRVSLMGWNSVVNAGMGGTTFQRALAQTAVAMGEIDASAVTLQGKMKNVKVEGQSFRDSIMAKPGEQSWLSSKVLTNTLRQFTGDLSDAELAAQGFSKAQIQAIKEQAKTATDAATKVKTMTQLIDVAKETAQSGWKDTWQLIFGNFNQAKKTFTGASEAINELINNAADARNKLFGKWNELGGRTVLLEGIRAAFDSIVDVMSAVRMGFRTVFPATTGRELLALTEKFTEFMKSMQPSVDTFMSIRRIATGVAAIFSIVGQVFGAVWTQAKRLFGAMGDGSGEFLLFFAQIGTNLYRLDQFLEKSGVIENFFEGLGDILSVPLSLLAGVASLIGSLFDGFNQSGAANVTDAVDTFTERMAPLEAAVSVIGDVFAKIGDVIANAAGVIGRTLGEIGTMIANMLTPETFEASLDVINTSLLAGLVLMIRKFMTGGLDIDLTGGLFDGIKDTLGAATGALQNMQASLKADILMKIAIALGILTAALVVLAMIDGKKLTKALTAMSVGFAALVGVMAALMKVLGAVGLVQIYVISASITKLALALLVLALALKVLSSLKFGEMLKGLTGLAGALFIIKKAMIPLAAGSKGMSRAASALILLGVALNLIAVSLKILASMSWEELGRGLTGVAGSLVAIGAAMRLMPKGMLIQAAAIVVLSAALNALGVAMKIFASMSWKQIGRGLTVLAASLGIIAIAMRLMPKGMILQATALVAVGVALNAIGVALKGMGKMSWEEIGKGLVTLAGALVILAGGLYLMSGGLAGAAALVVAAGALAMLTPVLLTMGAMDWMNILKSLTMLAGVFVVLGLAGFVLAPVVPVILALGAAMLLIGAGLALAGAGALLAASAFAVVIATGTAGIEVLGGMLLTIIKTIPRAMIAFAKGIVSFVHTLARGGPRFVNSMSKIISNMLDAVIKNVPKMGKAFTLMILTGLKVVLTLAPRLWDAGLRLIVGFLKAIERHVPRISQIAINIIVKFINTLARNIGRIIQAGVNLIIKFIEGLTRALENNSERLGTAGADLALALVNGMANGIGAYAGRIKDAALAAAREAFDAVVDFFDVRSPSRKMYGVGEYVGEGLALGVESTKSRVGRSAEKVGRATMDVLRKSMRGVADAVSGEVNVDPVISPVLDLTQVEREAGRMGSMLNATPIRAGVSFRSASIISSQAKAREIEAAEAASVEAVVQEVKFEQNNYSPKALSPVEIYRNTRNQLSLAKEALQV